MADRVSHLSDRPGFTSTLDGDRLRAERQANPFPGRGSAAPAHAGQTTGHVEKAFGDRVKLFGNTVHIYWDAGSTTSFHKNALPEMLAHVRKIEAQLLAAHAHCSPADAEEALMRR